MWLLPSLYFLILQFVLLLVLLLPSCLATKKRPSRGGDPPKKPAAGAKRRAKQPKDGRRKIPSASTTTTTTTSTSKNISHESAKSHQQPFKYKSPKSKFEPLPTKSKQEPLKSKFEPPKTKVEELMTDADLFTCLKLTEDQIEAVRHLSKDAWTKWREFAQLDLYDELERLDRLFLDHKCKDVKGKDQKKKKMGGAKKADKGSAYERLVAKKARKSGCDECNGYRNRLVHLRLSYLDFNYPTLNGEDDQKVMDEIDKRMSLCGEIFSGSCRGYVKRTNYDGRIAKGAMRRVINDFLEEKKKHNEEKKKRKEMEQKKRKEETKQTASGGGGGGGQYECLTDAVGGQFTGQDKGKKQSSMPEEQYESLFPEPPVMTAETQESVDNHPFDT